jgi:hypothetical protein
MPNYHEIGHRVQEEVALALASALPGGELKRQVARATGRSPESIRDYCKTGRLLAPLDVIREALDLTVHPALFAVMETERYHLVPKVCGDGLTVDSILLQAAQKAAAGGRVQDAIARAMDPEGPGGAEFTRAEKAEALEAIDEAARRLAALREGIKKL